VAGLEKTSSAERPPAGWATTSASKSGERRPPSNDGARGCRYKKKTMTAYKKKDNVVARQVAGEPLLIPIRGKLADMQQIFALNEVAQFIWKQIDGAHTRAQIAEAVVNAFEVSEEQAAKDLDAFLDVLLRESLVEVDTEPEAHS